MAQVNNDKGTSPLVRPAKVAVPTLAVLVAVPFLFKYFGVSRNKSYFSAATAAGVTGLLAWRFTRPEIVGLENLLQERVAPESASDIQRADSSRYLQLRQEATTGKHTAQILAAWFLGQRMEAGKTSSLKLGDNVLEWNPGYEVEAFTAAELESITGKKIVAKADTATITGALVMIGEDKRYISFEDANQLFASVTNKLQIVLKDPKNEGSTTGPIQVEVLADGHKLTCTAVLKNAGLGIRGATYEEKTLEVTLDNLTI